MGDVHDRLVVQCISSRDFLSAGEPKSLIAGRARVIPLWSYHEAAPGRQPESRRTATSICARERVRAIKADPPSRNPTMHEPRVFAYSSQGLRLNVCEWGAPDAPPLVLLHGLRDHARSWDLIASALADRYRVLAPDLRGHGDSEHARGGFYPTEGYVFDLAELVEQQRLAPFVFIGHSLGGNIGLRYAGLYPDRVSRLVAIEGLAHSPKLVAKERAKPIEQRLRDWIERQRDIASKPPRRYGSLEEATARVVARHPRLDPDFAAHNPGQDFDTNPNVCSTAVR